MVRRTLLVCLLITVVIVSGCAGLDFSEPPSLNETTPDGLTPGYSPTVTGNSSQGEGMIAVHSINVGQADANLVIGPDGETILIDSGDWRDDGETVLTYLETHNITRIDHLIATHAHADHIGGHAAIIDHFETNQNGIGAVYDSGATHTSRTYERYLDAIERHDVPLYEVREDDELPVDTVQATVYNPPEEPPSSDLHENSIVVQLTHGNASFLLTGDAEVDVEQRLSKRYGTRLESDVYYAGHHGSNTSSSDVFLETVAPSIVVISSAYDSQYGHPHNPVLARFAAHNIDAYWTATHGSIVIQSDGRTLQIATQAAAETRPLDIRSSPAIQVAATDQRDHRETHRLTRLRPISIQRLPHLGSEQLMGEPRVFGLGYGR